MKRALLVGIDSYKNFNPLSGCVNDVLALEPLLARHGDGTPNFECRSYVSGRDALDRKTLLAGIDVLLGPGADVALLYFAGHGMAAASDVALMTQDAESTDDGVPLATVLTKVRTSSIREIVIVLDCCFSGGAGGIPQLGGNVAALREGLALFSASRADQTAAETEGARGLFSTYFCGALEGGAADVLGKVTLAGIYAYLAESFGSWDQRPTFKANLERMSELRIGQPAVAHKELRQLPNLFPDPDFNFPLAPAYEPSAPEHDPELGRVMAILQRCRSARLIEPVGAEHLYYAAMGSKACRLTPLGKHYWRMASQGRL